MNTVITHNGDQGWFQGNLGNEEKKKKICINGTEDHFPDIKCIDYFNNSMSYYK